MRVHVFMVVLSVTIAAAAVGQEEPPFDVDDVHAEAASGTEGGITFTLTEDLAEEISR